MQFEIDDGSVVMAVEEAVVVVGVTEEESAQIAKNKQDIEKLNTEKLDASQLPEAVNDALALAKESGVFDGKDGKDGKDGVGVASMVYDGSPNPREIYVDYYATNLVQGVTYKVTVDVMGRLERLSGGATGKVSISLVPRNANNAVVGSPVQGSSVVPSVTEWKTLEWTVTIPSNAVKPVFRVGFYNAFGTAYVDNLKITQLTPTVADVNLIDPSFEEGLEPNQKTGGWTYDDWNINFVSLSSDTASNGTKSAKLQYGLTTQWKIIYTDGSEHLITAPMFSSGMHYTLTYADKVEIAEILYTMLQEN